MTEGHPESRQPVQMEEDSISLLDLLVIFAKHKKKILLVPILTGGIAAGYSLQLPEIFASQTTLLPPEQQKGSSAMMMLNQLGPMAGLAGDALGVKSEGELFVSLLKSRRIGDRIIEHEEAQDEGGEVPCGDLPMDDQVPSVSYYSGPCCRADHLDHGCGVGVDDD